MRGLNLQQRELLRIGTGFPFKRFRKQKHTTQRPKGKIGPTFPELFADAHQGVAAYPCVSRYAARLTPDYTHRLYTDLETAVVGRQPAFAQDACAVRAD